MKSNSLLLVISGPSGTGKGTVIRALREEGDNITVLPSVTTRNPRKNEKDGFNYFFKDRKEFEQLIKNNEFVEWVEYCDNFYGTLRNKLEESLKSGNTIILEKEVKGAVRIKRQYPDSISIFLLPPNFKELKKRIQGRGTEDDLIIRRRLNTSLEEISYIDKYDYVIINRCVKSTVKAVDSIIRAERLRTERNVDVIEEIISYFRSE